MEILEYAFMRRALLTGFLLAVIIPCIGVVVVLKRLSMIGDALSHASLAGVAAGMLLGINPVLGAVGAGVAGALCVEGIRRKLPQYAELSIAVVLSAGVGLSGVLSGFISGAAGFNSFLFGSIVAITDFEFLLVLVISILVLLSFALLYRELFYLALDERSARLAGVPVKTVSFLFTILTAVTISVAARTVGALIVSSLMVIPVACALQFCRSYRGIVLYSIGFAVLFMMSGLSLSFYADLRPGGAIVLAGVACLLVILAAKALRAKTRKGKGAERIEQP